MKKLFVVKTTVECCVYAENEKDAIRDMQDVIRDGVDAYDLDYEAAAYDETNVDKFTYPHGWDPMCEVYGPKGFTTVQAVLDELKQRAKDSAQ